MLAVVGFQSHDSCGDEWSPPAGYEMERSDRGNMGAGPPFAAELDAVELAHRLIGGKLLVDRVGGTIVETEAYLRNDPASHSFRGPTQANAPMFGPPWRAYIYRSYGLHWCFNIVTSGHGAVLIRALAPENGIDVMIHRRGTMARLCAGPGRLTQALGITGVLNGSSLADPPFEITLPNRESHVLSGPRIGISRAREELWRFGLAGSPFLSKPFGRPSGKS